MDQNPLDADFFLKLFCLVIPFGRGALRFRLAELVLLKMQLTNGAAVMGANIVVTPMIMVFALGIMIAFC